MIEPLKQLHEHQPPVNGDCFRTCIAMCLGWRVDEVPHFVSDPDGKEQQDACVFPPVCVHADSPHQHHKDCQRLPADQHIEELQQTKRKQAGNDIVNHDTQSPGKFAVGPANRTRLHHIKESEQKKSDR